MDDIHFEMTKIKNKLKDLSNLHDKHLNRPTLDDNFDEERSIDNLTQEITNVSHSWMRGYGLKYRYFTRI